MSFLPKVTLAAECDGKLLPGWGSINTIIGITAACYRSEKAQIPKSAGGSAGKSAGKKGTAGGTAGSSAVSLLFHRSGAALSTAPSGPPSSPLFPGTLPSTPPGTFGDLGFLTPVAGGRDSYSTLLSEIGRRGFRRVRFQTPSSVSFFGPHQVPGTELSDFLSAFFVCVCANSKANSPSFSRNSPSLPRNLASSLFRNSSLEAVFRPCPVLLNANWEEPSMDQCQCRGRHF